VTEANRIIESVRSCIHAAKCIKDTHQDALDLKHSSHDIKYHFYSDLKQEMKAIYEKINHVLALADQKQVASELLELLHLIQDSYKKNLTHIYSADAIRTISHLEIATLININRELFTSHKAMVMCMKSLLLSTALGESFSELPTYQA
jgi:phosphate:Na+ symporter